MTTVATLDAGLPAKVSVEQALRDIDVNYQQKNHFLEALTQLMVLAKDHVTNAKVWFHIGHVYTRMANWSGAMGALDTALTLNSQLHEAKLLKSLALFSLGRRDEACALIDQTVKRLPTSVAWMMRAYLHAHSSSNPKLALDTAYDWGRRFADPLTRKAKPLHVADRSPRKKLKIGYVTADFRQHSVAFFMLPVLMHHNHDEVDVCVYNNGPWDGLTPQLRIQVPVWHDVMGWSNEAIYQRIRADEIDVLIDLSGYTHGNCLGVFAMRAAPVQVTWLGYLQPLGMKAMDYRLVTPNLVSPSQADYYSEALFQLQVSACYAPPAYSPLCELPPIVRNGYPTLISPNSSAKITDEMLKVWARILHDCSEARLIIMVKEGDANAAQADMQPRVEAAGFPLERVSVLHQQPLSQFMEIGHIADIMLDTAPISGGTTALHSMWMGMPIVTMDGERGVDASCAYFLKEMGFGEDVAQSADDYVQIAIRLMSDVERLCQQRTIIRERMRNSAFMNYSEYTRNLEKSFRIMWLNMLRGDKRDLSFDIDVEAEIKMLEGRVS
ncbi:O-linked N-acetylglucosamine transferase, SPINDLY family protein [Comamonas terrigena]|uniref:O-linked N-acetylglucosamine transferase, SPINDLY family protein n=1 Tax=Comamonas terrigena TaxID=32013 RepID=UPI0028974913|nr:glycosyltransferase [Comamonas terrigena]